MREEFRGERSRGLRLLLESCLSILRNLLALLGVDISEPR